MRAWGMLVLTDCGRLGFEGPRDGSPVVDAVDVATDAAPIDAPPRACLDGSPMRSGVACTLTFGDRAGSLVPGTFTETWIASDFPTSNYGGSAGLHIDNFPSHIGLMHVDLTAIPIAAQPQSAELRIWGLTGSAQELTSGRIQARLALEDWEQGVENGADATPNFTEVRPGVAWSGPGTTPLAGTTLAFELIAPTLNGAESIVALDLAALTVWIDQPAQNLGVVVTSQSDGAGFESSETAAPARRPLVTVAFVPP